LPREWANFTERVTFFLILCCPSARSAPAIVLSAKIPTFFTLSPSNLFFFNDHERKCRPYTKLCLSWRLATRAPSPIYLFLLFWMTARTFLYQAARMETRCCANGPAIGSAPLSVTRARFGAQSSVGMRRALRQAVPTLQRTSPYHIVHTYRSVRFPLTCQLCVCCSKIWDTYSGQPLHSFPHNHIVRSVAISPSTSSPRLLTGGQEKKVRIFDIGKPDAEPDILSEGGGLSHDGTIKSVLWFDENIGVSGGEDRVIK
jgi:hypothetical protein